MTESDFLENEQVQDAVLRNIEIIGEAARNIERNYPEFASQHSDVPWEEVYLMRNRICHGYFSVDLELVGVTEGKGAGEKEQTARAKMVIMATFSAFFFSLLLSFVLESFSRMPEENRERWKSLCAGLPFLRQP